MVKSVDTWDLKSQGLGHAGSSPAVRTNKVPLVNPHEPLFCSFARGAGSSPADGVNTADCNSDGQMSNPCEHLVVKLAVAETSDFCTRRARRSGKYSIAHKK